MLKYILQLATKRGKSISPNPNPELKLVFKKGAITDIKKVKGWHTDSEMAKALGLTRQYVSMMKKGRVNVTHTVITRLAYQLGNINGSWWSPFEIIDRGEVVDPNHPLWNEDKFRGRVPYAYASDSALLRSKDYKTEKKAFGT